MKSEVLSALVCLLLSLPAVAQDQTAVSLKIDLVSWSDDIPGLSVKAGDRGSEVTALAFQYSQPISYAGPAVLEIFQKAGAGKRSEEGQVDEGKTMPVATAPSQPKEGGDALLMEIQKRRKDKPELVALAAIPANSKRVTILLAPAAEHTFRAVVIDDDPSKLPPGKLRIHNYGPTVIAMRCNKSSAKELKTKEAFLADAKNCCVVYELAYQDESGWKMQENNVVRVGEDEQVQMIVLKSDSGFFQASNGTRSGFLQTVVLRRHVE